MNKQILFNSKDHSYNGKKITYTSVSTLIGRYKKPYNREYWSTYKAYEKLLGKDAFKDIRKKLGYKMEDSSLFKDLESLVTKSDLDKALSNILSDWEHEKDKSIKKGNDYHSFKEDQAKELGFCENPYTGKEFPTIHSTKIEYKNNIEYRSPTVSKLYDLEDGFHPELILWDDESRLAGQSDLVFIETINGDRFIDIDDFKGLALDTPIATSTGWKYMKDIEVGDTIFDGKGNLTKVSHISKIHYNPCYKVKFDNNTELICDHEHKWVISKVKHYNIKKTKGYYRQNVEMTTDDIFDYYQNNKLKLAIEINSLKTKDIDLFIDPYLLGLWLADGNRTCGTITCINDNIWDELEKRGYKLSNNHNIINGKACSRTVYGLRTELRKLNLLGNKHIPDIYLRASLTQRLNLLRGYMDGDGYFHKVRNRYVMSTTSSQQASDMQSLICSLGYKCTIIPYKTSGFGKTNIQAYQISFRSLDNPFLIRNNYAIKDGIYSFKNNFNYIKSIEKIDTVPTKCLAVESTEHTYLAGKSLIMTHNTNKKIVKNSIFGKMRDPLGHLDCCNYNHYRLQISMYAKLLEKAGFIPRYLGFRHLNTAYRFDYMKEEVESIMPNYYDF